MSLQPSTVKTNLSSSVLENLNTAAEDYYLKQALYYIGESYKNLEKEKQSSKIAHDKALSTLVEQNKAESKIQPFIAVKPYALFKLRGTWAPKDGFDIVEETYKNDLLLVAENEEIIKKNTEIIDSVVKALEIVGLEKVCYKYPRVNSKSKIAITSEWYKELVTKSVNNYYLQGYSETGLKQVVNDLKRTYDTYIANIAVEEKQKLEKEAQELAKKAILQREAVLVAHACVKYNFNPLEVLTREALDEKLVEKGLLPSKILQDLEFELFNNK